MPAPKKGPPPRKVDETFLEYISYRATRWVGSTASLIFHTVLFLVSFLLYFLGVELNTILLVLTTLVSLEAIYLAIFIQMSVNRQDRRLRDVAKDVDEIQEDVDEIQEDIDEIQEDVEEIQEGDEEYAKRDALDIQTLAKIEQALRDLGKEVADLRRQKKD